MENLSQTFWEVWLYFFSDQTLVYGVEASWLVVNKFVVRSNSSIEPSSSWGDSAKLKAQGEISNGCWSNHYWIRLASSQLLLKKVNVKQKKRLNWPNVAAGILYTANVATRIVGLVPECRRRSTKCVKCRLFLFIKHTLELQDLLHLKKMTKENGWYCDISHVTAIIHFEHLHLSSYPL